MKVLIRFVIFVLFGLGLCGMNAQSTYAIKDISATYLEAVNLFNLGKYASSYELMGVVKQAASETQSALVENATYYEAVSAARLLHKNAAKLLTQFMDDYPESSRVNSAFIELANIYYTQKLYAECINTLNRIDEKDLTDKQREGYQFKKAYSYFMIGQRDNAKPLLYVLKNGESQYQPLAAYYYAYVLYLEGSYQTALEAFEQLKEDENFGDIVPFYIIQIYYKQGKNDSVISQGKTWMNKASSRRATELSRLIGEAYYNENQYTEALPCLRTYFAKSAVTPTREDNYLMGFVYYSLKHYDTAVIYLQKVATAGHNDLMAQNTLYHLGYSYVQLGLKRFAQAAFNDAAKLEFDPRMQEDAFYNYAKLAYELAMAPYDEAIKSFQAYLNKYPNSRYADEIYGYLVKMYYSSKNYKIAYSFISQVKRKDPQLLEAMQRISYNYGIELFNKREYPDAIARFDDAMEQGYDDRVTALAAYWRAEAIYRLDRYADAMVAFDKFLFTYNSDKLPEYVLGNYGMGYTLFQSKQYTQAIRYFNVVIDRKSSVSKDLLDDAYLRIGDAYYMTKSMSDALRNYDAALALKQPDMDYATLQKAICLGVLGRYDEKLAILQQLVEDYPKSQYFPRATNELASAYLIKGNDTKALECYQLLASSKYEKAGYTKQALLKQGLIQFNAGKHQEALKTFEKINADHAGTVEAKEALMSIRNIYVAMNKVDDFFAYMKKTGTNMEETLQDSISFSAAEARYMAGDYSEAKVALENYVTKFQDGMFITEAYSYLADCELHGGNMRQAQIYFDKVIQLPESFYTEKAMITAAKIAFDRNEFEDAIKRYQAIAEYSEIQANVTMATIATMRSAFKTGNLQTILHTIQDVLRLPGLSDDIHDEAIHTQAQALQQAGQLDKARALYKTLNNSTNAQYTNEAKYYEIEDMYSQNKPDTTEKMIFDYISKSPTNEYYLAKVYILWGNIYFDKGNYLQAKQTYQSIIDNYEGEDDVIDLARECLQKVINKEIELQKTEDRQRSQNATDTEEELHLPDNF